MPAEGHRARRRRVRIPCQGVSRYRVEPGTERQVPQVPASALIRPAGAGVGGPLMQGDEPDPGIGVDQGLGPVAVVDVPIDDQHARGAPSQEVSGAEGGVGHEAEAHRPVGEGVMPRGTNGGKRPIPRGCHSGGGEHRARGTAYRVPRRAACHRVGIEGGAVTVRGRGQSCEVLAVIHRSQFVRRVGHRLGDGDALVLESPPRGEEPSGRLRVPRSGIVTSTGPRRKDLEPGAHFLVSRSRIARASSARA